MAESNLGSLAIYLTANTKQFNSAMYQVQRSLKEFSGYAKIGLAAGSAAVSAFMYSSIKSAIDAQETYSKFSAVFAKVSKDAEKSAQILQKSFGLSEASAKQLLSNTGDLLTGFGFSPESALELSESVNKLAVDLASFTNYSGGAKGASEALTKALLGERESLKSLGISILEEDVKMKMAELAAQGLTFATERQAKAYATLKIAQEQSKNAIGDYARTSDGAANQIRLFWERMTDLKNVVGQFAMELLNIPGNLKSAVALLENFTQTVKENGAEWVYVAQEAVIYVKSGIQTLMALFRPFVTLITGLGKIILDVFMTAGANIANVFMYLFDGWSKLFSNFIDIAGAFALDIGKIFVSIGEGIFSALTGKDFDWTGAFANIGKETERALAKAEIPQLKIEEPDWEGMAKHFTESYNQFAEIPNQISQIASERDSAFDQLFADKIAKINEAAQATIKPLEQKDEEAAAGFNAKENQFAAAVSRGTAEAYRLELAKSTKQDDTQKKTEDNTKQTAQNTASLLNVMNTFVSEVGVA